MAYQMIYTSIRSGLVAGRSGFCTAARHREIKESLVARFEDLAAQYDRSIVPGGESLPEIYTYRIITIRGNSHHLLMRVGDAGNDYSGRNNHIAHGIVLSPEEVSSLRITPAEVMLQFINDRVWRTRYEEAAQYFGPEHEIDVSRIFPTATLPAAQWLTETGSAANAAQLLGISAPVEAGIPVSGATSTEASRLCGLFAESLLVLDPHRVDAQTLWSIPFTTLLQSTSESRQFTWCGCLQGSSVQESEARSGRKMIALDTRLQAPSGRYATIAETGEIPREVVPEPVEETSPEHPASTDQAPEMTSIPLTTATSAASSIPENASVPPHPESSISLGSNFEPRSRADISKRKKKTRRILALTAITLLILGGVVGMWWSGSGVREAEAHFRKLISSGSEPRDKWGDVKRDLESREYEKAVEKSEYLRGVKLASGTINRYRKLIANLGNPNEAEVGSKSVEEAFDWIVKGWEMESADETSDEIAEIQQAVEKERGKADAIVKAYSSAKEEVENLWDEISNLRNQVDKNWSSNEVNRESANSALQKLEKLLPKDGKEEISAIDSLSTELSDIESKVLPAIKFLAQVKKSSANQSDLKNVKGNAESRGKDLMRSLLEAAADDSNAHRTRTLTTVHDDLRQMLKAIESENENTIAKTPPTETTENEKAETKKDRPEPMPKLHIFSLTVGKDFEIQIPPKVEERLDEEKSSNVLPLDWDKDDPDRKVLALSHSNGSLRLDSGRREILGVIESGKIQIDEKKENEWEPYKNGFRFEFGNTEEAETWDHFVFLPVKTENNTVFLDTPSLGEVLRKEGVEFFLTEPMQTFLKRLEIRTGENASWSAAFKANSVELKESVNDVSDALNPLADLESRLEQLNKELSKAKKAETVRKGIAGFFESIVPPIEDQRKMEFYQVPVGNNNSYELQPDVFLNERQGKLISLPASAKNVTSLDQFKNGIINTRKNLEEFGKKAGVYKPYQDAVGNGLIRDIESATNREFLSKCRQLAANLEESKQLEKEPDIPDKSKLKKEFEERDEAEDKNKEYQTKVFEVYAWSFLHGWKTFFSEDREDSLREYFSQPSPRSPAQVEKEIRNLEEQKQALGQGFLKNGEFSLYREYTETVEIENGPDKEERRSLPILRTVPNH